MQFTAGNKIFANGHFGSVVGYYSENMIEIRLPGGVCCIDQGDAKLVITKKHYDSIHKDYRGTLNGKRSIFAGCLFKDGGTVLICENEHFIIKN